MSRLDFDVQKIQGLTSSQAARLLKVEGLNELGKVKRRTLSYIIIDVLKEPMLMLLLASSLTYLLLGSGGEAILLSVCVLVVIGITIYQEGKTERVLDALRNLSSPRALVIRDGKQKRISGREVVRGDIAIVDEGERIPADAAVLFTHNLRVNEAILTGESIPVSKIIWDGQTQIKEDNGENSPFVYGGTIVSEGYAVIKVLETGDKTRFGQIGESLRKIENEESLLRKQTKKLLVQFVSIGAVVCLIVIVAYGVLRHDWLNGFLAGLALAMSLLPEEFPVILTVFLSIGAWRIGQKQVLARRAATIETLGAATVLCVDKTGTITQNTLKVSSLMADEQVVEMEKLGGKFPADKLPDPFQKLVNNAYFACRPNHPDPVEKAVREFTFQKHDYVLVKEYPLSASLLARVQIWRDREGKMFGAAMGSPEAVAKLAKLGAGEHRELEKEINRLTSKGLRLIGVGEVAVRDELPEEVTDLQVNFLGVLGLSDPVRSDVLEALKECKNAGLKVIMITGDYPGTAITVAEKIGLNSREVLTGPEMEKLSSKELEDRLTKTSVCARIMPAQKLALVNAFKAKREVVAMTGDGVNDAPALKAAHIGIAMGERGTDVAREASSLVLLKDDFASIVQAVRLGRRIYDNIKKAVTYVIAMHVPIAGLPLISIIMGWPLVLLPAHIAFMELIIDPACSVVFEAEAEEEGIMNRPPRLIKEKLFNKKLVLSGLWQGLSTLVLVSLVYVFALNIHSEEQARALAFASLVFLNLSLILVNRSWSGSVLDFFRSPNPYLWKIAGAALVMLTAVLYVPFLEKLFRFESPDFLDLLICLFVGILNMFWLERIKKINGQTYSAGEYEMVLKKG